MDRWWFFKRELSEGQEAIRKHALSLMPMWQNNSENWRALGRQLRKLCLTDPIVQNDKLLNQPLKRGAWSNRAYGYLQNHSRLITTDKVLQLDKPVRFFYSRDDHSSEELIFGGAKYDSTFSVVIGLAHGETIVEDGWSLCYYEDVDLISISGGGNHRTLGHLIYGQYEFRPDVYYIFKTDELPVPFYDMNAALIEIEDMFPAVSIALNLSKGSDHPVRLVQLLKKMERFKSTEALQTYFEYQYFDCGYFRAKSNIKFEDLVIMQAELTEWQNSGKIHKLFRKYFSKRKLSYFEQFLDEDYEETMTKRKSRDKG